MPKPSPAGLPIPTANSAPIFLLFRFGELPGPFRRGKVNSRFGPKCRVVSLMYARLIPIEGGSPFVIEKDLILIGRNEECELRLDHKSISKLHCILVKTDGLILVRDLGSTNGTRVNGQRVRRAALLPNDQFSVANFKYRVSFGMDVDAVAEPIDTNKVPPVSLRVNDLPDVIIKTVG